MDSPLKIEKALPRAKGEEKEGGEGDGENAIAESEEGVVAVATPVKTGGAKKSGKKRGGRTQTTSSSNGSSDGIQPDPRWADKLAQLKEMLAAANN
jgi:hypothetical protein